jgi:hypothetical protein
MRDITDIMNNYRECVRHLWNTYFRTPNVSQYEIESAFHFDEISNSLFAELVLSKIGKAGFERQSSEEPWPFLALQLSNAECPALINRPSQEGGKYWDEDINRLSKHGANLRLIGYFDWDEFGYVDYRYYKVKIISFTDHPHLNGRQALIETSHARVFFAE